jgi:hypothetical protein
MKKDEKFAELGATLSEGSPKIVVARDGGPIRRIINGRHIVPTSLYPSFKGNRSLPTEADHEYGLLEHCDIDKAVVHCLSQPHRVEIPVPWQDQPLIYFPDAQRDLADGGREIFETSEDDNRRLKDPHYTFKLDVVGELYDRIGWRFRRVKASEVFAGPLYANAHLMAAYAHASVSLGKHFALEAAIGEAGGALPMMQAAAIVGSEQLVYAMIVQRHVWCDLKRKVVYDTPILMVDHHALRGSSPPLL